jgi:DNA-directed RNA polymerase specialized sigma subunit
MVSEQERDQRRRAKATDQRATEMYRLRTDERLTLKQIAERYERSPERVRQIIRLYCHLEGLPYPCSCLIASVLHI